MPFTSATVSLPSIPASPRCSFTASNPAGSMTASIFFISSDYDLSSQISQPDLSDFDHGLQSSRAIGGEGQPRKGWWALRLVWHRSAHKGRLRVPTQRVHVWIGLPTHFSGFLVLSF